MKDHYSYLLSSCEKIARKTKLDLNMNPAQCPTKWFHLTGHIWKLVSFSASGSYASELYFSQMAYMKQRLSQISTQLGGF